MSDEALARRPVLVVDDDPDTLALIEAVLTEAGFAVLTAADGHAALALARTQPSALVPLDGMPAVLVPPPGGCARGRTGSAASPRWTSLSRSPRW